MTTAEDLILPKHCRPSQLAPLLVDLLRTAPRRVSCVASSSTVIPPAGLALLGASLSLLRHRGVEVEFNGDRDVLRYLARMELMSLLGLEDPETFNRKAEAGRFLPLTRVSNTAELVVILDRLGEVIIRQFDNAVSFIKGLECAATEILDNTYTHSETPVPAVVCAQFYAKQHRVEIGLCDMGIGIPCKLAKRFGDLGDDKAAIIKAFQPGVTSGDGEGNGLAMTQEVTRANRGSLNLWSGTARYKLKPSGEEEWTAFPSIQGTGVWLALDVRNPVNLESLSVGGKPFGSDDSRILDRLEAAGIGGLRVRDHCHEFVTEADGESLRRLVEAIVANEPNAPVIMDFEGVDSVTPDFVQGLFLGLIARFGASRCKEIIGLRNTSDRLLRLCNEVVRKNSATSLGAWRVAVERALQMEDPSQFPVDESGTLDLASLPEHVW